MSFFKKKKKHSSQGERLEGAGAGDGILFGGATTVVQVRDDGSFPRVILSALTVLSSLIPWKWTGRQLPSPVP